MKVRESKDVFSHSFVCQYARASLGERQASVQEVPGPSTRPGGVGPRGQKPLSDKYFHEVFTWRPHESWPGSRSGKVRLLRIVHKLPEAHPPHTSARDPHVGFAQAPV